MYRDDVIHYTTPWLVQTMNQGKNNNNNNNNNTHKQNKQNRSHIFTDGRLKLGEDPIKIHTDFTLASEQNIPDVILCSWLGSKHQLTN